MHFHAYQQRYFGHIFFTSSHRQCLYTLQASRSFARDTRRLTPPVRAHRLGCFRDTQSTAERRQIMTNGENTYSFVLSVSQVPRSRTDHLSYYTPQSRPTAWRMVIMVSRHFVQMCMHTAAICLFFPVYHYFRRLCALVRVVFCVRLSICVLFHETLCFYHTISYYSSIQLLSCKCVFIKLLCVLFITVV